MQKHCVVALFRRVERGGGILAHKILCVPLNLTNPV